MKKELVYNPSSRLVRSVSYFIAFTASVVAISIAHHFTLARTTPSLIAVLGIIALLAVIGGTLICERNVLSRVVSASTLLSLGFIAVKFDGLSVYLLPLALGISILGAQNFLHRKPKTLLQTAVYSSLVVAITLAFVCIFIYGTSVLLNFTRS